MLNKAIRPKKCKLAERPWGKYLILEKRRSYWLKKLFIKKGEQLSLQSHKSRYEVWTVLRGRVRIQKGGAFSVLRAGESVKIRTAEKHRIYGLTYAIVLEAAFGQPKERDVIRYQDKYGRV